MLYLLTYFPHCVHEPIYIGIFESFEKATDAMNLFKDMHGIMGIDYNFRIREFPLNDVHWNTYKA
jgi:hypothetical protein